MYLNNFILVLLYLPVVYFYIRYFGSINKPIILNSSRKHFNKLFVVIFLGILLSMLVGYRKGKFPTDLSRIDLSRIVYFLLVFIVPFVMANKKLIKNISLKNTFNIILFAFVLFIGYSLIKQGIGKSAFYGNFFGATTVNLSMVSVISYYGLFFYYLQGKISGLILSILAWLVALASLAKWNFWVDVTIPILLYSVWISGSKRKKVLQKVIIVSIAVGLFFLILFPNLHGYLNSFASMQHYSSFDSYLDSRVFRTVTSNNIVESGTVFDFNGKGISDGARLPMWSDLLNRTIKSPFIGLGIGVRAFDYQGIDIEDHSIFIFFISRFGFFLAAMVLFYLSKILKSFYTFSKNDEYPLLKYIYVALIGNFFFQGLVGMMWGQLPVTLLLGIVLSIIYTEIHRKQLNTNAT